MAQSVPYTMALQFSVNGIQVVSASLSAADNTSHSYVDTIATGTVNQPTRLAFAAEEVQAYILYSDQNVTIDVNSTSAPLPAISLTAKSPLVYIAGAGMTSLFTTDVTEMFVSNASGQPANVTIEVLVHGSV